MKNKQPLFTICMPVYKVEEYISFSVEDLVSQTFVDFECIMIDDKSPDNSIQIAKDIVGDDSRFKFLHNKNNMGVSYTRNRGLAEAKGEYIIFLDSDDRYDSSLLERVRSEIIKAKEAKKILDIVVWEFGQIGLEQEKIKNMEPWREDQIRHTIIPANVYQPEEVKDRVFQININAVWSKCFRVEFLKHHNILFDKTVSFGEDALFSYFAICKANYIKAVRVDNILYYYRKDRLDSAMHTIDFASQIKSQIDVILKMEEFLHKNKLFTIYESSFKRWVNSGMGSVIMRVVNFHDQRVGELSREINSIKDSRSWRLAKSIRKLLRLEI